MQKHSVKYPSLRAFASYISTFKLQFGFTLLIFIIADVIITLVPWLIGQLTNSLINKDSHIMGWTIALIVASVGHDLFWRSAEVAYLKLLLARSHRFSDVIFGAIMQQNYSYFVDKFTGKVSSYANSLGQDFRELLENVCWEYANFLVAIPIIAATMFTVNSYTGVIFIVSVVLMLIVGRQLATRSAAAERDEADERSTMDGYVVDAISNFVSVKAFGNERHEASQLYHKRHRLIRAARYSFFRDVIFWGVMSLFIRWIIWPSTFILNVYLYTQGQLELSQMTTFLTVIVLFSTFVWDIIWNISQLNIKVAGIEEAYRYLFGERNIITEPLGSTHKALSADAFSRSLELKNISFAYPDKREVNVLKNINLTIQQGEKIGVVGPSGGGKSTLLKLLLGYYPLEQGSILLDGVPIDNRSLTDLLAYVPQDTSIFHRSIRDNIAYGKADATDDAIVSAAKHAQAHDFILALDKGYDTFVGERGVKLSGGQRQRVAIARAILKDAPLLLLDEATSALDSESEQLIQAAFDGLLVGHTAIVIAHRLSTIQKMDRIIVMDHGKIAEQGSHAELISQNGLYAKLWAHQSDGFIKD